MHLRKLQGQQAIGHRKVFINVRTGLKQVMMHLRIQPGNNVHGHKKNFFTSGVIKTSFDAFEHTDRPSGTWSQKVIFYV
jgi:hypothetical protein